MTVAAHDNQGLMNNHGRAASGRNLTIALGLTVGYTVVELAGGFLANSLSLLADAGHMITDAGAIGLALLAMWIAGRPASIERTFGLHRTEVLAALANALALWLIAGLIFFGAYRRFLDVPAVDGRLMLVVGGVGLLVNSAAAAVLRPPAKESLNVEGAFLHVVSDVLGSIAVIGAGLLIVISSARLLWKVLMEGTPAHLDLHGLCQRLERLDGITGVHDIHAWSITTGYDALSAHVTADAAALNNPGQVLERLRNIASQEFGISHVTIQLEASEDGCVEGHHIAHPG